MVGLLGISLLFFTMCAPARAMEPAAATTKLCWETSTGDVSFCNSNVSFDGGGQFASPASKQLFMKWAKSGPPVELDRTPLSGILRWTGGDCAYSHGVSGNWTVWCGTSAAMNKMLGDWETSTTPPKVARLAHNGVGCSRYSGTARQFQIRIDANEAVEVEDSKGDGKSFDAHPKDLDMESMQRSRPGWTGWTMQGMAFEDGPQDLIINLTAAPGKATFRYCVSQVA